MNKFDFIVITVIFTNNLIITYQGEFLKELKGNKENGISELKGGFKIDFIEILGISLNSHWKNYFLCSKDIKAKKIAATHEIKTELSQTLQALSEKAKTATEFIQRLKATADNINVQCEDLEHEFTAQCDALVEAVHSQRTNLMEIVHNERDFKLHALKYQMGISTHKLQQTTGLLQYCIEVLKETDFTAFLQISSALINRVANMDITWQKEMSSVPLNSHQLDLTLDIAPVMSAIGQLNFMQIKSDKGFVQHAAPGRPIIILEDCSAVNNSVTIAWQQCPSSVNEGFILELDDGDHNAYRVTLDTECLVTLYTNFAVNLINVVFAQNTLTGQEVYCGKDSICTVDGLHFNTTYNARVKAFNSSGEGPWSEFICLQTAGVAWFTFDSITAHPDVTFSNDNFSVVCESYEQRMIVGTVGFSRGIHYWEFTIDRYDSNSDVVFGVARFDVDREIMLGKDDKGWGMVIDHQRSWFLHCDRHEHRTEGGVKDGLIVGVLLDLCNHRLSFYVDQKVQGPVAFSDLFGVFYPAISINRSVAVTLCTGLEVPTNQEIVITHRVAVDSVIEIWRWNMAQD
uniref:B30.2/SPRY domain-containing protein n=1 Tax=Strigamia maritima TaxID=126957 RepID=T1J5V0_STRMM